MWRPAVLRCPRCGAPAAPEFVYCYRCGTPLRMAAPVATPIFYPPAAYAPRYPAPPVRRTRPGIRTRWGLALTAAAVLLFSIPFVSLVGAALLSIASTLLFVERRSFHAAHRSAMVASYALFWVAAIGYVLSIGGFLWTAYDAWLRQERMSALLPATVNFIAVSTLPTAFLIVALALQIRFLLPPRSRGFVWWAALALILLALAATYVALDYVPATLGNQVVRTASVGGVLNDVGLYRIIELPGFAGLAYLYVRAFRNVVSPSKAPAPPAAGRQG